MKRLTIAVDGHSSCGKSTMARALAKLLGYIYVDTGAMYRAVTLFALRAGMIGSEGVNEAALCAALSQVKIAFAPDGKTMLNGECVEQDIRQMPVSQHVSAVSAIAGVRAHLVDLQRAMGRDGGVVMDGRDIGTTVFPDAELKVFVTADAQIRAQRRYKELQAKGQSISFEEVLANVKQRDYQDEHRKESPLRKASDAVVLDNGAMTIDQQNAWLKEKVDEVCARFR